jgi:hypothetical protein
MQVAAFRVLRTVGRPISRRTCRVISGTRHALPRRNFHRTAVSQRGNDDPPILETEIQSSSSKDQEDPDKTRSDERREDYSPPAEKRNVTANSQQELNETSTENKGVVSASSDGQQNIEDVLRRFGEGTMDESNQAVDVDQKKQSQSGSGRLRSNRSRQIEGTPPVILPDVSASKENIPLHQSHQAFVLRGERQFETFL